METKLETKSKMQAKRRVRNHCKMMRDMMPAQAARQMSGQACGHILNWGLYQAAGGFDIVLFYYPLGNELSLLRVIEGHMEQGRRAAFPKVTGEDMEFYEITNIDELEEGFFHVMEPAGDQLHPVKWEQALCFVPGTAFDRAGGRLGYGRGYYDRYFAHRHAVTLAGCAYECQIAEELPVDVWDIRMDYLVSERGICRCAESTPV